jgi:hypothetical protein
MRYTFYEGCLISAPQVAIRFIKVLGPGTCVKTYNSNERIFEVTYSEGATYDQVPGFTVIGEPQPITIEGDIKLYESNTINGLTFYNRYSPEDTGRVWSCFIDTETYELTYNENEVGGWLIYPSVEVANDLTQDIIELINTNSTKFYITCEETFKVSNIQAIDLNEKVTLTDFDDIIPYGKFQRLYLTEADIIDGFIKECKTQFPEIEFFPQSSERKNKGKETIYYKSQISQERSIRFSSNILDDAERGRVIQTTIPIEISYQTADIQQYIHRRNLYLLNGFLMDVHNFKVIREKGYTDRYGRTTETFTFSTFWDRTGVNNEIAKGDTPDTSGRDGYSMMIVCDLIGFIIEKSDYVKPINQVIVSIYAGSGGDSFVNINTFTLPKNITNKN